MLNVDSGIQKGMAENEDIYFQSVEARNELYNVMPDIVNEYMNEINKLTGKDYKPFNYYGSSEAKNVIVAMGSVCDTVKLVVEDLTNKTESEMMKVRNLGRKSFEEVMQKLASLGYKFPKDED